MSWRGQCQEVWNYCLPVDADDEAIADFFSPILSAGEPLVYPSELSLIWF